MGFTHMGYTLFKLLPYAVHFILDSVENEINWRCSRADAIDVTTLESRITQSVTVLTARDLIPTLKFNYLRECIVTLMQVLLIAVASAVK